MIIGTQSIGDFPIGGKSAETRMREEETRLLKQKPNLEYKTIIRKIKGSKNKSGRRITCYINLTRLFVIDEAHAFLKADKFNKLLSDAHKAFTGQKVSKK